MSSQEGCVTEFTCPSGFKEVVIGQERSEEAESLKLWCQMWSVIRANDFYSSPYVFVTCADYNSPTLPPVERNCFCNPISDGPNVQWRIVSFSKQVWSNVEVLDPSCYE
uniref:Thyroglobulin type-1 domain-containing protein n=1 Tax=Caenorhabditis tropicalis TaxID=1561998 RepID=A0A1I7T718_9PELO